MLQLNCFCLRGLLQYTVKINRVKRVNQEKWQRGKIVNEPLLAR